MADSYSLIDGQVVPYSGGRMSNNTDSWRNATDLELEQQEQIEHLEKLVSAISDSLESCPLSLEISKLIANLG